MAACGRAVIAVEVARVGIGHRSGGYRDEAHRQVACGAQSDGRAGGRAAGIRRSTATVAMRDMGGSRRLGVRPRGCAGERISLWTCGKRSHGMAGGMTSIRSVALLFNEEPLDSFLEPRAAGPKFARRNTDCSHAAA
jgi:hypothetical protein